jgi:hypothetical protein
MDLVYHASANNIKRILADAAYDSRENFRYLSHNDIEKLPSR